jgi:hypothetical protein
MNMDNTTAICLDRPDARTLKDRVYCWCCGLAETEPELCRKCHRMSV